MGDPSRRDVLRLAGATALAISCGDNVTSKPPGDSAGSAIFEPTEGSFLVSAWLLYASSVTIEVSDGLGVVQTARANLVDAQAVAEITGLQPSTEYQVTITANDATQFVHTVRTAPALDDMRPIRLAVSADLDPIPEFENGLIGEIAAAEPDVFVTIGDFPYTDDGPPAADRRRVHRARHLDLRSARRACDRCSRAPRSALDLRRPRVPQRLGRDARRGEPARYAAAIQVWDEFFPLRGADRRDPLSHVALGRERRGFLLDCRRFRSADADPDGPDKTMLGADQQAWFLDAMATTTATFKLVFTTVPLDFGVGNDAWATFTTSATRCSALRSSGPGDGVLLSGDQHWFAAHSPRVRNPRVPDGAARPRPRHAGPRLPGRAVSQRAVQLRPHRYLHPTR